MFCIDRPKFNPKDEIELNPDKIQLVSPKSKYSPWDPQLHTTKIGFEFPGAYEGQRVRLEIGGSVTKIESTCDSVLIFAFDNQDRILFVKHRSRGWELIGGKVEKGELPEAAARREALEEAGVELDRLFPIGHYFIYESDCSLSYTNPQKKMIYFARVLAAHHFNPSDTVERCFLFPPKPEQTINDSEIFCFSPLLKDNVYAIGLRLAQNYL